VQIDRLQIQEQLPGGDARGIQKVIDQPGLGRDRPLDCGAHALDYRVFLQDAAQDLGRQQDGVEGGPQLMGEQREEQILGVVGPLGCGPGPLCGSQELGALGLVQATLGDVLDGEQDHLVSVRPENWPTAERKIFVTVPSELALDL